MEKLDVSMAQASVLSLMEHRVPTEHRGGHQPTRLKGLDQALRGGIPFGVLTELVGPAGIGKTQFCLKLALLASLPASCGGFRWECFVYRCRIQIQFNKMAGRLLVMRPTSLTEFTERSLAEFSRIPVVVTNQVRSQSHDEVCQYSFQGKRLDDRTGHDFHLVPALGIHWARAVTIRLVLVAKSGKRFIKLDISSISPPLAFPFNITSSGVSLLTDDGIELTGPEINTIHCQGYELLKEAFDFAE